MTCTSCDTVTSHHKQSPPPEWTPKSLKTVEEMNTRPEQWGLAPIKWGRQRIEQWEPCRHSVSSSDIRYYQGGDPSKGAMRKKAVEERTFPAPLRSNRSGMITDNPYACNGSGIVWEILNAHDSKPQKGHPKYQYSLNEEERWEWWADECIQEDVISSEILHFEGVSRYNHSGRNYTSVLLLIRRCPQCSAGENLSEEYQRIGETLVPNSRGHGLMIGEDCIGQWVPEVVITGKVEWPEDSDYNSRFSHLDCQVCGKNWIKSGLVPVIGQGDDGVWNRMWVGQDCAKRFLGFKQFTIQEDECLKCEESGTLISNAVPLRLVAKGEEQKKWVSCEGRKGCGAMGSHQEMVKEYDMESKEGSRVSVVEVKGKDIGASVRWFMDDGTLDLHPHEKE